MKAEIAAAPRHPAAVAWRESQLATDLLSGKCRLRIEFPTRPRTISPRWRAWEEFAMVLAATMAAMYGGKIHLVLKNPAGRQKIAPTPVAAAATIC